jgi:metal-dependent amidase/aminoacylase/carboxypeptidase family protein
VGPDSGGPEAQALVAALATGLTARGRPRLVAPGPQATHRALVTVEQVGVSQRPHHVRHYRSGVLVATLTIAEARGGEVIFADRATAETSERARDSTERQILDALVAEVASRWLQALDAQAIDDRLRASRPPPAPSAPHAPQPPQPIDERGRP